tara:strand:- start:4750 stop:5307 length:558 start_codon:yes stop_codon:yes gene_type:complete
MATYEATKYDFNGAALTGIQGLSTGTIVPWTTNSAPTGFLECNGAAVSRSTYSALFTAIGTTYGSGNGSSTFNVPDMQDKNVKAVSNNENAGTTGGGNNATPNAHTINNTTISTNQFPSHSHSRSSIGDNADYSMNSGNGNRAIRNTTINTSSTGGSSAHTHGVNAGSISGLVNPYLALMYIIKT